MKKMNPVVHFELPATDRVRMADFYTRVFGWQAQLLGPEMGDYVTVATGTTDEKGFPTSPGVINGGLYPVKPGDPAQYPSVVISVDDIKQSAAEITKSGGKVLGDPVDIPGIGSYVSFIDTEGNRLSILQPVMQ